MINELQTLISANVFPGSVVTVLIGFIFLIVRSKPITMFTATDIEKIIYTKEKKALIRGIDILYQTFIITIALLTFIFIFTFSNKTQVFFVLLWIAVVIISILTSYFLIKLRKPGIKKYFENMSLNAKGIHSLLILFYCLLLFLLIPLFMGATAPLTNEVINTLINNEKNERLLLGITLVLIFIFCFLYRDFFSKMTSYFDLQMNNTTKTNIYIKYKVGEEISDWYLFHPTETDHILIGDNDNIHNCNSFYLIERSDLMKQKIYRTKNIITTEEVNENE